MAHWPSRSIVLLLSVGLSGCTTWVDVKKVEPDSQDAGIRYALPATFLLVQPQADGTASYSWVYLPDPDKTYAIRQHAFLAKFTLDVTVANGLLSKVNSQTDDTAIAAKLLDSAQSVYAAKATAAGTQAKADASTLATAKTALANAQLALTQAQLESGAINAPNSGATDAQKLAAKLKLIDAQAASTQAQTTVQSLAPGVATADLPASPQQWGPILFRVVQDASKGVKLVAVNQQTLFDTATAATGGPGAVVSYTLALQSPQRPLSSTHPLTLSIAVNPAIDSVDQATSVLQPGDGSAPLRPAISLSADKKTLTVTVADGLRAGTYIFIPAIVLQPGTPAVATQQVGFQVNDH